MQKNYLEYFLTEEDKLHFDLIAMDVYKDLFESIAKDETLDNFTLKRKELEKQIIERLDYSKDEFVRAIIGYSLLSGIYFVQNSLSSTGMLSKYSGKRFKEFYDIASRNSFQLAKKLIDSKSQYRIVNGLLGIAVKTTDKRNDTKLHQDLLDIILNFNLENIYDDTEILEFIIPALNYLIDDRTNRVPRLMEVIDFLIKITVSFGDTAPTIRSKYNQMSFDCVFYLPYDSKIKWYQKEQCNEEVKDIALQFAKVYEDLAEKRIELGGVNLDAAVMHLESAIQVYLKYKLQNSSELKKAKARLDEIKNKRDNESNPNIYSRQKNLMDYYPEKGKQELDETLKQFSEVSADKQLHFLLQSISFISKDDVKNVRKSSKAQNQFFEVFPTVFTNELGQTVFEDNTEENKESLALFNYIKISGVVMWMHLLKIIFKEKISIDFTDLISRNEILNRRIFLVNKALRLFFEGDIYSGLYLLTPQIEWWFREVAREAGEQISNLKNFPIEQSKTLTPVFETEALKEYLGDEVHWLFKQLMTNEPMNVRNKVAHGLELNDNGYCSYFVLCVMKLMYKKISLRSDCY